MSSSRSNAVSSTTIKTHYPEVILAMNHIINTNAKFGICIDGHYMITIPGRLIINRRGRLYYKSHQNGKIYSVSSWIKKTRGWKAAQWLQNLYFTEDDAWVHFRTKAIMMSKRSFSDKLIL
jgi:hypothetical protein